MPLLAGVGDLPACLHVHAESSSALALLRSTLQQLAPTRFGALLLDALLRYGLPPTIISGLMPAANDAVRVEGDTGLLARSMQCQGSARTNIAAATHPAWKLLVQAMPPSTKTSPTASPAGSCVGPSGGGLTHGSLRWGSDLVSELHDAVVEMVRASGAAAQADALQPGASTLAALEGAASKQGSMRLPHTAISMRLAMHMDLQLLSC